MGISHSSQQAPGQDFRHEALLYAGPDEFTRMTTGFLREGLGAGEPSLVVVVDEKIDLLRAALGADADAIQFADMAEVGRNPGRIISAWLAFVEEHRGSGARLRGVGEPIWAERTAEELAESQRHEALLNLALAGMPVTLACPYDTVALSQSVLDEAHRTHPFVLADGVRSGSTRFVEEIPSAFDRPLPPPAGPFEEMSFAAADLRTVRDFAVARAAAYSLEAQRAADFVFAVNELTTNSVRHGGGSGRLRLWREGRSLICEVADHGRIEAPLIGRRRPPRDTPGGLGLWMVNQICDLVQVRTFSDGVVVRMHMLLG